MKYTFFLFFLSWTLPLAAQPVKRHYKQADNEKMLRLLDSTHQTLLSVVQSLSDAQFFYRSDSETWSASDIVEHLGLTDEGILRELWISLSQPIFPSSYVDSTKGGDNGALAYATHPEKSKASGVNLPRNRYSSKETSVRIFSETNDLIKDFFIANAAKDLRRFYSFRLNGKGIRSIQDLHQLGLALVTHRIRQTEQLIKIIDDPRLPQ